MGKALNNRSVLIRDFYEKYNLEVADKYQETLKDFLTSAQAVEEERAIEDAIQKQIADIKLSKKTSYGYSEYSFTFTNNTDAKFDYFSFEVQLLDKDDVILDTTYASSVSDFAPGQKAKFEFMTDEKVEKFKFIPNYSVEN